MAIVPTAIGMLLAVLPASPNVVGVTVDPPQIRLEGSSARRLLLVEGTTDDGGSIDLTRSVHYVSIDPAVAQVDQLGVVRAVRDGKTTVVVEGSGPSRTVEVTVEGTRRPRAFNFENDIVPVLSKLGCNASGCHGKAEGQNGFKLSVFGFDPAADHAALTEGVARAARLPGRTRAEPGPDEDVGQIPHGGGVRAVANPKITARSATGSPRERRSASRATHASSPSGSSRASGGWR